MKHVIWPVSDKDGYAHFENPLANGDVQHDIEPPRWTGRTVFAVPGTGLQILVWAGCAYWNAGRKILSFAALLGEKDHEHPYKEGWEMLMPTGFEVLVSELLESGKEKGGVL